MKSLILLAALFSTQSFAATRYETVKALYDAGTPLALSDLEAAYAGRCFYAPLPGTAYGPDDSTGALLVGHVSVDPASDAGPEFAAPSARYKVNAFNANADVSDEIHYRYDNWTQAQAMEWFNAPYVTSNYATSDGKNITWHSKYNYNGLESDKSARRSGVYIVVFSNARTVEGVKIQTACYFYKKLP